MRRIWIVIAVVVVAAGLGALVFGLRPAPGDAEHPDVTERAQDEPGAAVSPEERAELRRIATLGYISGSEPVPEATGVVRHDEAAALQGPTLYSCSEGSAAILMDMHGEIIHSWSYPGFRSWGRVHLYENGDVLAITESYPHLMKLDKNSRLIWEWNKAAHHDLDILPDGSIAVLVSEEVTRPDICDGEPFLSDSVIILTADGTPTRRASVLESFERSREYSGWVREHAPPGDRDLIHANSVEVFYQSGRRLALVSLRNLDTVAVMDLEASEVVWAVKGPWHRQHEARFVPRGVLLFDNLGLGEQSRVIEYDTERSEIVWSFTEPDFFSESEGAQQRLPNGNTLITESDNGRLIEVTRDGRIVWEYINPVSAEVDGEEVILGISRAERLPRDFPVAWAEGGSHERPSFGGRAP